MAILWNSLDKSANVSLSGGSLTATMTSATQGAVRADTSFASGKLYYEVQVTSYGAVGSFYAVGWANASAALSVSMGAAPANSVAFFANYTEGPVYFNGVDLGKNDEYALTPPQTIGIAFDIGASLFWARFAGSFWNGSSTADPATGVGGRSVAGINAGPYFPAFSVNASGAAATANFGATDFFFPVPAGFSGLEASAQAYLAASKMLGFANLAPPVDVLSVSKMLGFANLDPPSQALSISKMISYAVLVTISADSVIEENMEAVDEIDAVRVLDAIIEEGEESIEAIDAITFTGFGVDLEEAIDMVDEIDAEVTPVTRPLWLAIGERRETLFPN